MSARPSSFTVTSAGQSVGLDSNGAGQASFTVTNTSAQPLKGRMVTRPSEPAKPEWFSIVGEAVRDFAPNAAQQVVAQLNVPPTTPPGSYSFRLDAVSEAEPDEDFTEGPSISFELERPATPTKKRFPWWIIAVAAGIVLLIVIGIVVFLLVRDGSKVVSSGTGAIPNNALFDFDAGTVPPAGVPGADVLWSVSAPLPITRSIGPAQGTNTTVFNMGVVDFDSIDKKQLSKLAYATTPISGNLLPQGANQLVVDDVFAVHTADGNFAKVKVVPGQAGQIGIQWVTYED